MDFYTISLLTMVLTLILIAGIGIYYGNKKFEGIEDYLSARASATVSLGFATFIAYAAGSGLLFSPPESAVTGGLPAAIGYGLAIATPYLLYITVAPKIKERMPKGYSVVEYAELRYGKLMYVLVLFVSLFYMFILMTANLTGIALALESIAGIPLWITVSLIGIATMIYLVQGGLLTSLFTDMLQTLALLPLLVISIIAVLFYFGGPEVMFSEIQSNSPELLSLTYGPGLEFAVYIIIALLGAEMLNQSLWQRAHAAKDRSTLRKSLSGAAIVIVPMTVLAGLFGIIASGTGIEFANPSAALPAVIETALSPAFQVLFIVLMVMIITSTLDNALTGMVSIFTVDVVPKLSSIRGKKLLQVARIATIGLTIIGIAVASTGPSVLYLLLRADLLAAATFVPIILGLYTKKLGGKAAFTASILGIIIGIPWFMAEEYLYSFASAFVISLLICIIWMYLRPKEYSFENLMKSEDLEG